MEADVFIKEEALTKITKVEEENRSLRRLALDGQKWKEQANELSRENDRLRQLTEDLTLETRRHRQIVNEQEEKVIVINVNKRLISYKFFLQGKLKRVHRWNLFFSNHFKRYQIIKLMLILVNITLYYSFFLLLCEVHIQEKIVYNQTAYPKKKSTSLKTLEKQVDCMYL